MKKLISILVLLLVLGCVRDEEFIIDPVVETPDVLFISELQGIKLASAIVSERVAMNVKLPVDGIYRIKIKHGLNNELISQEKIQGKEGDNILSVYVNALEKSSYRLELSTENHELIGATAFSKL